MALKSWDVVIGTGLAGYKHEQIAPMFVGAPENYAMPKDRERV